jgi:hypothetical protein
MSHALLGLGYPYPRGWVGQGVSLQVVGGAGSVEVLDLGEVGVVGVPLHTRLLSHGAHGGPRGADGLVQLHGGLGNPSAGFPHALGPALHLVFACHERNYYT